MQISSATELDIYKRAYRLAMDVFDVSKSWPSEERFALIDQIRRSSRSVCANLREAWAKRRYEAHFISKLTDADGENAETGTWLAFAKDCGYLKPEEHIKLIEDCHATGAMLGAMMKNPKPFLIDYRSKI